MNSDRKNRKNGKSTHRHETVGAIQVQGRARNLNLLIKGSLDQQITNSI
jgi:hypothetical protein